MEYTMGKLSKLAGVTARTLRYYDQIGLLVPARISSGGYRIYGRDEVERLQLIMFYRELDIPLEDIGQIISAEGFDTVKALEGHLDGLIAKKDRLERLISTVEKTISSMKGENTMSDREKFEGFKQKLIHDNEEKYGGEVRNKYGDDAADASNAKLSGMTIEEYDRVEKLSQEVQDALKSAFRQGDPAGKLAQSACEKHREWLLCFWPEYDKSAHLGLGQMYVDDPRFKAYYDEIAPGCAEFLRDALAIYCK